MKKKKKTVLSKFKKCFCRTTIVKGTPNIFVNKEILENYFSKFLREMVISPIKKFFEKKISLVKIVCNLKGGGKVAQAQSVRNSIIRSLIFYFKMKKERDIIRNSYRYLLVDDKRAKAPKKQLRKGARAKYQLSFR